MDPLVSICVPTCRRPALVQEAIESCLAQTYPHIEVLVCDDSADDDTESAVQSMMARDGRVRYYRNRPPKGQAGNVNRLFELSEGARLVLLHDDDLLQPRAVEELAACWDRDPTLVAAFGKQYVIDMDGRVREAESDGLNASYSRTSRHEGRQPSAMESALVAQFPNDGYMVRRDAAQRIGYRDTDDVGDACDYDFGLRLAAQYDGFYFVDRYVAKYRITRQSVSKNNNYANVCYALVESLKVHPSLESTRAARLRRHASAAVTQWLVMGEKYKALRILCSRYYPGSLRFALTRLAQFALLLLPTAVTRRALVLRHSLKNA